MTSKHHKWQRRWRFDPATGRATHESGLVVAVGFRGAVMALNAFEVERSLALKNGPHNAPKMIQRLMREAADLAGPPRPDSRRRP